MIKIFIAFAIFAAISLFALMKGGDIDMGGEKHGMDAPHTEQAAPAAPAAAPAAPAAPAPAEQPK
ncbi:MAG: hypothetical protein KAF64_01110 [Hydrogenophaga sp.]|uniref:hypothetical protein n=1 Tax=Hydrogenophaga sp. TaxID=1904254 RepID=UPI0025C239E1|nr:hypothetical protein [Hydrogenophaga sp.]MBU7571923.1 hypothetical protein [Hydrogenophaga sp.]